MSTSLPSRALLAASLILGLGLTLAAPAHADDDDWHHRGGDWHDHEWREHEWREHQGWGWGHRDYYEPPPVVYAPPPAPIYVPPPIYPAPGLNVIIPLHIR
jgi:hypothetical protein